MQCKVCEQDNPPEALFCANCGATLVTTVEPLSPAAVSSPPPEAVEYMGFWIRFGASIIDGIVVLLISFVLPGPAGAFGILLLWLYYWLFTGLKGQTLGKMAFGIKVVNAQGDRPGLGVAALREVLGKTVSVIALYIGFLWIIGDKQKQGWHDKIASTYVVKVKSGG